jgi:hypothetical protein
VQAHFLSQLPLLVAQVSSGIQLQKEWMESLAFQLLRDSLKKEDSSEIHMRKEGNDETISYVHQTIQSQHFVGHDFVNNVLGFDCDGIS